MSEILLKMYVGHHVKCPLFLFAFNWAWILSTDFFFKKIPQISNFMKIRPVGAELFHADRWIDGQMDRHDETNILFSKFCEEHKK